MESLDYDTAYERLVTTWEEAARHGEGRGVRVGWEFEPGTPFNRPSEIFRIAEEVRHPGFGIIYDTTQAHNCALGLGQIGEPETLPGGQSPFSNASPAESATCISSIRTGLSSTSASAATSPLGRETSIGPRSCLHSWRPGLVTTGGRSTSAGCRRPGLFSSTVWHSCRISGIVTVLESTPADGARVRASRRCLQQQPSSAPERSRSRRHSRRL